ncbi:MAG: cation transporter [Bryobacterales bacterium]|nr:cation transporter [Bryobacterales bacterium]
MGSALIWSLIATVLFVVIEFAAGMEANSLALLSDAGHNLTDALALLLAGLGLYYQRKPPDSVKTFGYHRAGVLAAFANALTLIGLSVLILYECVERFRHPEPVGEMVMLVVAAAGLVVNVAVMLLLHKGKHDLNIRAAFLHMMGDALGSAGIVAGAVVIRYTGWNWLDPALSLMIAVLIIWTAWDITRESLNILLEGLPRGMDLQQVVNGMMDLEGVLDVHDIHIWSLGSKTHAMSCHILIRDMPPSASEAILRRVNTFLRERHGIDHTTIQFEHARCNLPAGTCPICQEPAVEAQSRHEHL